MEAAVDRKLFLYQNLIRILPKNLLKSVKIIINNFNSKIPATYNELITLPGVGDYTAKAILGIAYNLPYMPIDTNVKRLLCRIYGL